MNPFERARTEAHALRQRLVQHCATRIPTSLELLSFVESELNLAIEKVPVGFAALGGGGAVLERGECFIYVRDDVKDPEYAYLVAHELGHWALDADKPQLTIAHLKSLVATEGTPAAVKVEAYGARERQELQANVFARELLLPRQAASELWRAGKGTYQIAKEVVLPLELVRLQLLDALLLPISVPGVPKTLPAPSSDQKAAAEARERFVNVVAGPGTGKTTTLVHRVKYLIEQQGVDPSRILVLTFTNKAAFELVERLRNAGIQRASDIWAGTFHAFGLEFLRKYHQHFGLDADVLVADKLHQMSLLIRSLPQVDLKYYLRVEDPYDWLQTVIKCIQRLKEELVSPEEYRSRLAALEPVSEELQHQREDVASLYEAHEGALRDAKMVDFVDLVAKSALRIRDDRDSVAELANHFEHVLVDEYQDVTEAMVMLVRQLAINAKSLWVVGDVRQAIHHWRGASVKSLMKFEHAFRTAGDASTVRKYSLDSNRRSSTEILDLFSVAGRVHVLEAQLPLDTMHAVNGKSSILPELISCDSRADIHAAIAQKIIQHESDGIEFRHQAVLCRKGADVEFLAERLRDAGVRTLYIGELAQRSEIKRLLCLMQLLCEREPRALVGLADQPGLGMPMRDIAALLDCSHGDIKWQRGRWLGSAPSSLSAQGIVASVRLQSLLAGFTRHSNPWHFVCDVLLEHRFGLPNPDDDSLEAQTIRIALWQFAYSVRNGDGDVRQARLSRYLLRQQLRQRIGETHSDRELPPEASEMDAVRLLTVHGSKGLEFEAVHIGYVDADAYGPEEPKWGAPESIIDLVPPSVLGSSEEEYKFETAVERNNLFYVALSRAKLHLRLYENVEFGTKGRPVQLKSEAATYKKRSFNASEESEAYVPSVSPQASEVQRVQFDEFEAYSRCPLQHHYRYRLQLSREQETDIAVRARWAVMDTLKAVVKDSVLPKDAFAAAWASYHLPSKVEDPGLIRDAINVCKRGLAVVRGNSGTFGEMLVAKIGGVEVELPWLIETGSGSSSKLHLIRFSAKGSTTTASLLRPMLLEIEGKKPRPMMLHTLLVEKHIDVPLSQAPTKTAAFKAAIRMQAGDRGPSTGRHCGRCAYLSMCPVVPT
ncbi:UvrD-helicase domain-containing protein [Paraburkholderia sp. BCC1876]|uniref:UvrD-helicase domain-containing protein n=1 Tax=Paraburkholderia sp. BCC1876 TaxID=2676303 RepID=UPI0015905841|nr:UvrD-helicase domain-containing protein [Paraburkholderia sp. BCC1876]